MTLTILEHPHAEALADALAERLGAATDAALADRGSAWLALAGGRTAPPVIRRFAAQPRHWTRVTVLPSDERWVADDHPDCNLRQLREAFGSGAMPAYLALAPPRPAGTADAAFANAALAAHPTPFDAVLLGMGGDGHFASLFPGASTLAAGLDPAHPAAAIAVVPDPLPAAGPHPRVSLTLARLLRTRRLLLAITGADKRAVLAQAARGADPAALPVAALMRAAGPALEIHWSP